MTRRGLAANLCHHLPAAIVYPLIGLLVIANTINIAADLAAMGEAMRLVVGGKAILYGIGFGIVCLTAEIVVPYHRYVRYLKWMTLVLLVYVACALTVSVPWRTVLAATFLPSISFNHEFMLTLVAVFGTTISPYLFFWQTAQEKRSAVCSGAIRPRRKKVLSSTSAAAASSRELSSIRGLEWPSPI